MASWLNMFLMILLVAVCHIDADNADNIDIQTVIRNLQRNVNVLVKNVAETKRDMAELKTSEAKGVRNMTYNLNAVKTMFSAMLTGKAINNPAPSCTWIYQHYNIRNGYYWVGNQNSTTRVYCDIETMVGRTSTHASPSCKWLKQHFTELKTGLYWVLLDKPTQVYCDMATGFGGWTMIGRASVMEDSQREGKEYTKLLSSNITKLSGVTEGSFLLSGTGLKQLRKHIKFTQMRFYCHKPWHGRTVHIHTLENKLGKAAVELLIGNSNVRPQSCGSYGRFENDNSDIGGSCERWCGQRCDGTWNDYGNPEVRMYYFPMVTVGAKHLSLAHRRLECDDITGADRSFSSVGEWAFYVR